MLSCLLDSDSPCVMMVLFFVCVGNLSLLSSSARVKVDCPTHAQAGVPRMQKCKSLSAENSELSKFPFFLQSKVGGCRVVVVVVFGGGYIQITMSCLLKIFCATIWSQPLYGDYHELEQLAKIKRFNGAFT